MKHRLVLIKQIIVMDEIGDEHLDGNIESTNNWNDYVPRLQAISSKRNSVTLTWNAPNFGNPTYKIQLKDKVWGWITKYWGFQTQVEIKNLGPEECYRFRLGVASENNTEPLLWSAVLPAVTKDDHIAVVTLQRAVQYGNVNVAKKFLTSRASAVDCYDSNGKTALMRAARLGDTQMVNLLLCSGASVNLQSLSGGMTALMITCWHGHLPTAQLLDEKGADWSNVDNHGCTALHYAVDNSQSSLVNFALDCGADLEAVDRNGWTPLMRSALLMTDASVISDLVERGANINACDKRGQTVLMQAVSSGHAECVKILMEAGTEVDSKNMYGNTAQSMAGESGEKIALMLVNEDISEKSTK